MTHLTQSAFAAHLGIARSYVTQLKKEGRLVMSEDGKLVDLEASQAKIAETADPGKAAVAGDGADPMALVQAHVARAGMLIITPADPVAARHMLDCARQLNPGIHCLIHTDSETSAAALAPLGEVFVARQALINAMGQRLGGLLGHQVQALRH